MRQVLIVTGSALFAVSLIFGLFALNQANQEQVELTSRMQSRSQVLADSLVESVEPSYNAGATSTLQRVIERFVQGERLEGLGVFDSAGVSVAASKDLPLPPDAKFITAAMDADESTGAYVRAGNDTYYTYLVPLHQDGRVVGALAVAQNATYIDENIRAIWRDNIIRLFSQLLLFGVAIFVLVYWVFFRAVRKLTQSIQAARKGDESVEVAQGGSLLGPLAGEISKVTKSLRQARRAASEEARMRLEKLDSPWTAGRLQEFIKASIKDREIFIVSNGEPYMNTKVRGKIEWKVPAGGVVTALEPVMEACGGTWIANGSGEADKETADEHGRVRVPPEEPSYTLKRIWIPKEDMKGYYDGFSNGALWPLCHTAHVRPDFRSDDWAEYKKVNIQFATTVLEEVRKVERPIILVQDYHLALVPDIIKRSRPDAQVALFWHIPWPSAAQFSICPWRREILEGMLGADLIGFHTQQYCINFMETVAAEVEARIDYELFSIVRSEHSSYVKPFPISIAFPGSAEPPGELDTGLLDSLGIHTEHLLLGVDRLDYTKGIPERFHGVEHLLETHPEYIGKVVLLQIGSPTRSAMEKYQQFREHIRAEAERINTRFATGSWKPIVLEEKSYSHQQLRELYQKAQVCLVTPLHDGMNLVSKEYVAAQSHESGSLILSQFTGASRGMKGALIVNPYSAADVGEAIYKALTMPGSERHRAMKSMRRSVRDYNIYRWSAELIKALLEID